MSLKFGTIYYFLLITLIFFSFGCKEQSSYNGQIISLQDSLTSKYYFADTNLKKLSHDEYWYADNFIGDYGYVINEKKGFIVDRNFNIVFGPARLMLYKEFVVFRNLDTNVVHKDITEYYNFTNKNKYSFTSEVLRAWKNKYLILRNRSSLTYEIFSTTLNKIILSNLDTMRSNYFARGVRDCEELYFRVNGKEGILDSTGNISIKPEYDYLFPLCGSTRIYVKNNLLGLMNANNQIILPAQYNMIDGISIQGLNLKSSKSELINLKVANNYFNYLNIKNEKIAYSNSIISLKKGNKNYLYYLKDSNYLQRPQGILSRFINEYAILKFGNQFNIIDTNGQIKTIQHVKQIKNYSEGLAFVSNNKKWGVCNQTPELIGNFIYDDINLGTEEFGFQNNRACVKLNGKWGAIDKTCKSIIPFEFDFIEYLSGFNLFICFDKRRNELQIFNLFGDRISVSEFFTSNYNTISTNYFYNNRYLVVKTRNKWLIFNKFGNKILEINGNELNFIYDNILRVKTNRNILYIKL